MQEKDVYISRLLVSACWRVERKAIFLFDWIIFSGVDPIVSSFCRKICGLRPAPSKNKNTLFLKLQLL